jgi:hypothetical protein
MKLSIKKLGHLAVILVFACVAYAQTDSERAAWARSVLENARASTEAEKARILKFDFAPLWTRLHDNDSVLGYIGENFQRMRIVILSATKQPGNPDTYNVVGKSMVRNMIRPFTGTIKIKQTASTELDEDYQYEKVREAGMVYGEYRFSENARQTNTGEFQGVFVTNWVVDKNGQFKYDEILIGADGYYNNQFAGTWTSYRTKVKRPASWGDSRIPVAGDLDIGAGEFFPDQRYIRNGWQGYRDAYVGQNKRALAEERRKWWK